MTRLRTKVPRLWAAQLALSLSCCDICRMSSPKSTLLLILATVYGSSLLGCSSTAPISAPPPEEPQTIEDLPNMDDIEANDSSSIFSSNEERASEISRLWLKHAERLSHTSQKAALAAYLRAAHTSLTALESASCDDAFNEACGDLRYSYEEALSSVVRDFQRRGWHQLDLSPTRYRITLRDENGQVDLSNWEALRLSAGRTTAGRRPGVGAEAAGCRVERGAPERRRGEIEICTPLTFALTFEAPLSAREIKASLVAYDASLRSLVPLGSRQVALAADFAASAALVSEHAASSTPGSLKCINTPSPKAETVIVVASRPDASRAVRLGIPLMLEESIAEQTAFCLFTLDAQGSRDSNARALAATARALSGLPPDTSLRPQPSSIFLAPLGDEAKNVSAVFLSRLKRGARSRAMARQGIRLRGVMVFSASAPADSDAQLSARAQALDVPAYRGAATKLMSEEAEQASQLHSSVIAALQPESSPAEADTAGSDTPLQVSPVY